MTKPYRSRGRVVLEVLSTIAAEGPVGITRLTSVANLTHGRIQEHLGTFEENGLIEAKDASDRSLWRITDKGRLALEELRRIDRAMHDFGINL